ncbi:diphthine--ammonia ligase [Danxiaibacter flavus]|uniref:Diphthine--ammonia ligase n=1 Tax=Danxiaibacter flavus TaxID=3049108 RepID=A0ABV3ZMN7_9BACT|nr:diphthine--ammonia ligase [Chitinophagaceae bacterium DXS]
MITTYMNWSGGKDSSLCLYKAMQSRQYDFRYLLTSVNSTHDRISMHGVRRSLLEKQAESIGIPLQTIELPENPSMQSYEETMMKKVLNLKEAGCTHAMFGDIFLEDLRVYREQQLAKAGLSCIFPLWKQDTTVLLKEFIGLGFKAVIVCINEQYLSKEFCGRIIDEGFLNDLPSNVDPCGENGEFHSFVYDGPIFKKPIDFEKGEIVYRTYDAPSTAGVNEEKTSYGFYFCDLI